jgi:transglutaminase-like putative cysteine protease/uncharacterized membrane protein YhaH (DUF805 family)
VNQRRQVTLVAAAATLLASAPMSTIFATWTWATEATLVVAAVCLAGLGARALRAPVWAQALAMLAALAVLLTWLFSTGEDILGTIPTAGTFNHFGDLVNGGFADVRDQGVPVPDRPGLLFLTTLGVGLVAVLVDVVAVGLRRPALAGFPMLAMYSIPVFVLQGSISIIPFVVGALGFLWLLVTDNVDRVRRFGRRFTGDGRDVDLWEPSPLAAAGRRLTVVGVLLAVLVPLAIPGMTAGLVSGIGNGNGTGTGLGSGGRGASVNLFATLEGSLNLSQHVDMVKAKTTDPNPYYLRLGVADELNQSGFRSRAPSGGDSVNSGSIPRPAGPFPGVIQKTYHAEVTILDLQMSTLPIYLQLSRVQKLDGNWLYDRNNQLLYSNRSSSKGKSYSFDYVHTEYSAAALQSAPAVRRDDPAYQFTQVPPVAEVQQRVAQLTKGKIKPYDKVRAIYDYFSAANGFSYSLSTKYGTSGSQIVDFLTNKQGFCEQYAAALAWLVRAAGIPARVAFGFTRGSNHEGDTYTLTNLNLHAWTEVYFFGFGWVPFDATPTAGIAGAVSPPWAPDVSHHDAVTGGPTATTPGPSASTGANAGPQPDKNQIDQGGGSAIGGSAVAHGPTWPWWLLGGALVVLALLALPALRRIGMRRRRRLRPRAAPAVPALAVDDGAMPGMMRVIGGPEADAVRRDAHAAWDEMIDTLMDHQIPIDESETPRIVVQRITDRLRLAGPAAEALLVLGRAEERARYARTPLASTELGRSVHTMRRAVAERVSRRTRLRAALMPPSVLLRWRASLAQATSATVLELGNWRDSLSPRRLITGRAGR